MAQSTSKKNGSNTDSLSNRLWAAANILRGPVDAADFKTYIFPLLFFKRICDAYDEEYNTALNESGGDVEYAAFPENTVFRCQRASMEQVVKVYESAMRCRQPCVA